MLLDQHGAGRSRPVGKKNTHLSAHSPRRGEVQRIEKKRGEKELVELFEDAIRSVRIDEMSAILDFIVRMRRP